MKKLLFVAILLFALLATGVSAAIDLTATSEPIVLSGNPGTALNGQFKVYNTESVSHTVAFTGYTLTHTQDSSKTLAIGSIANAVVASGSNVDVSFSIANTNVFAGTYSGTLTGTSTTNSALTDNIQIQATVNSNPSATVSTPSLSSARGLTKTVNSAFTITNNGNTNLNSVSITISDLSDGTNTLPQGYLSLNPSSTSINYGTSANVDITTNIPASQPAGVYTGTVTVNYGGSSAATSTITVTVRDPLHEVKVVNDEVSLGSSSQSRGLTIYKDFTVQNSGDYTEQVTLALDGLNTKFNSVLSSTGFTLQPGSSQTVRLTIDVPTSQNAGVQTIGALKLTFNQQTSNIPIKLETETNLEITKIETKVAGDSSDSDLDDGDTLSDEAKPGDEIEFEITVKNNYPDSADIKIEDIEIRIEPQDEDLDEVEVDESFELAEGRDKTKTLKITVPDKIYEGTYDLDIIVEGEDENGAEHSIIWTVSLEVQKDTNDVRITEAVLGTTTLGCVRSTELTVTIANFGAEDQEEAALVIWAPDLSINENIQNIYLDYDHEDSDNEYTKKVSINLGNNFPAGTYPITIKAYRDNDKQMDEKFINLKVEACQEEITTPVEDTTVVITPPAGSTTPGSQTTTGTSTNVVETVESSFTDSTAFILILAGINLLVLVVVVILLFKFLI